jgi:hypothetical protein
MFNKRTLKQKPITVIEGLPHTQLEEQPTNDPLEELFN